MVEHRQQGSVIPKDIQDAAGLRMQAELRPCPYVATLPACRTCQNRPLTRANKWLDWLTQKEEQQMAFPRLPKRERRPRSLGFVIKVIFASAQNEERAWRMLSAPSEEGGQLTSALRDKAMQSVLKPEQVRVVYRRGTIEVLVVLEGLRIGYELLSEYKDFTESAELLLHDLEGTVQQYLNCRWFRTCGVIGCNNRTAAAN